MSDTKGKVSSPDNYQSRFKRFPLPTYTWQLSGQDFVLHDFNDAALEVTQGGIAGMTGTLAKDFFADRPDIVADMNSCFSTKTNLTRETDYTFITTGEQTRLRVFCIYVPPDLVMVHSEDISELHEASRSVAEYDNRYKALFESSMDAIIVHDLKGKFLDANPAACRSLGYSRKEILELAAVDVYDPEILTHFNRFQDQLKEERSTSFETEYIARDGSRIPVDVRIRIIDFGNRKAILTIARDITLQKISETELRDSRESLQLALLGADIAVWDWNLKTGEVSRSAQWAEMLGYSPSSITTTIDAWEKLIHPDDLKQALARLKAHLEGRTDTYVSELRLKTSSSEWKWIREKGRIAERGADGKPLRITGTQVDITDRRNAEDALVQSEIRHRTLFDSARDAILVDCDDLYIDCNQMALEMFACNRDQIMGKSTYVFAPELQPDGKSSREYGSMFSVKALSGTPQLFEFRHMRLDGTEFDAEVSLNRIVIQGKDCLQSIVRDITERKKSEARLIHQNEFQKVISMVSTYFINIPTGDFDQGIVNTLQSLGEFTEADRAFLIILDPETTEILKSYEWAGKGLKPVMDDVEGRIMHEVYPWVVEKFQKLETVHIPDIDSLPPEAKAELDGFRDLGIRSTIAIPLAPAGKLIGFICLNLVDRARDWHGDNTLFLISIGDIVAHAFERKSFEKTLQDLATTDSLTGAFNRLKLMDAGVEEAGRAKRYDRPLSVLMMDVDYFKHINDTYGHAAGDEVLKQLTRRCFHLLRDSDIFGRHGGDEFAAILPESSMDVAEQVAARLRVELEQMDVSLEGQTFRFTVSIGLTQFRDDEKFEKTLNRADQALYSAKRSGRNRIIILE